MQFQERVNVDAAVPEMLARISRRPGKRWAEGRR